jgi:hypothetical protein
VLAELCFQLETQFREESTPNPIHIPGKIHLFAVVALRSLYPYYADPFGLLSATGDHTLFLALWSSHTAAYFFQANKKFLSSLLIWSHIWPNIIMEVTSLVYWEASHRSHLCSREGDYARVWLTGGHLKCLGQITHNSNYMLHPQNSFIFWYCSFLLLDEVIQNCRPNCTC